ncbi:flavin reductase family protein [Ornithinimicrobium avium]|uniref:Flavin reductase n=1 Tax=Ornithinimicrobium avium TaxID=2283195 RepID=A0A345NNX7_9MICO|nr:flavin reductase family protein [Ornithinimicrobium avium]AXH96735.1 flavin reductase [Ornithinimicrobium avium]
MSSATLHVAPPDLRSAFRHAATSTWVVTGARAPGIDPTGFTAISIASVSLAPPLVSFNIGKDSSSLVTLGRTRRAALHLLGRDQAHVATRFAADRSRRFAEDGTWGWTGGLPDVHGCAVRLTTTLVDLVEAGDSFLALARVERATTRAAAAPLVHHQGSFGPLELIGA